MNRNRTKQVQFGSVKNEILNKTYLKIKILVILVSIYLCGIIFVLNLLSIIYTYICIYTYVYRYVYMYIYLCLYLYIILKQFSQFNFFFRISNLKIQNRLNYFSTIISCYVNFTLMECRHLQLKHISFLIYISAPLSLIILCRVLLSFM